MIAKETLHCQELKQDVEALVEQKTVGKGKAAEVQKHAVSCTRMLTCDRTTFCRFVNPLTTRNPLVDHSEVHSPMQIG